MKEDVARPMKCRAVVSRRDRGFQPDTGCLSPREPSRSMERDQAVMTDKAQCDESLQIAVADNCGSEEWMKTGESGGWIDVSSTNAVELTYHGKIYISSDLEQAAVPPISVRQSS